MNFKFKEHNSKPNWVSSTASSESHSIKYFSLKESLTFENLISEILKFNRVQLIEKDDITAHFVFTTRLFRFKDDLYLHHDKEKHIVHVYSGSRVGTSDFGVNRKRVEAIREAVKDFLLN